MYETLPEAAARKEGKLTQTTRAIWWDTTPKWKGVTCKWGGCNKEVKSFGLCFGHYQTAKFSSKYEHLIPEKHQRSRCVVEGCVEPSYENDGLCRLCIGKAKRGTLGKAEEQYHEEMEAPGNPETIGGRAKNRRQELGLTRQALADRMGFRGPGHFYVKEFENKEVSSNYVAIAKYAKALETDFVDLVPVEQLPTPNTPGNTLKLERIKEGWTLQDAADRIGCSRERVRQVEADHTNRLDVLRRFIEVYDLDVEDLKERFNLREPIATDPKPRSKSRSYKGALKRVKRASRELNDALENLLTRLEEEE